MTQKKGKKAKIIIGIIAVVVVALVIILWPRVLQKTKQFDMELGENLTTDIYDYVKGNDKLIAEAVLDISDVDQTKAGTYEAHVTCRKKYFVYTVVITDTIAPAFSVVEAPYYVGENYEYPVEDFVEKWNDASNDVTFFIREGNNELDTFVSDKLGANTFSLVARDPSGNETVIDTTVEVDEVPQFINAIPEKWVKVESNYDVYEDVVAYDVEDGLLSGTLRLDLQGYDVNTQGDYTVNYYVEDSHGIPAETSVVLHVCDADTAKEHVQAPLSKEDVAILCALDYFSYKPLENSDFELAKSLVEPCLFDMWRGLTQEQIAAGWRGQYSGSAFIYDISPEYIYAITDEHCVKHMSEHTNFEFYNTYEIYDISYETITIPSDRGGDTSMFRIDLDVIPADTLLQLKKAYANLSAYDELAVGEEVFGYAKFWDHSKDVIAKTTVKEKTGTSPFRKGLFLVTSKGCRSGMSGTGIFDMKGRLVGVCYATGGGSDMGYFDWNAELGTVLELADRMDELVDKKVVGAQ